MSVLIPNTYLDRKTRKSKNFLFISYVHKDQEQTYDALNKLFEKGVNYWYDKEFEIGDDWYEKACEQLDSKYCTGVIVFVSKHTLVSDACYKELLKIDSLKDKLRVYPIILEYPSLEDAYEDIIKNKMIYNKNNREFTINEKIDLFRKVVGDNSTIFATYSREDNLWIDKFVDNLEKHGFVDKQVFNLDNTKFMTVLKGERNGTDYRLYMGKYYVDTDDIKDKILWRVVQQSDTKVLLVSEYVLDYENKQEVDFRVNEIFKTIEHSECVESFDVLDEDNLITYKEYISSFINTDYADTRRVQSLKLNYIKCEKDGEEYYKFCNTNGTLYEIKNQLQDNNYGIRLFMTLDLSKIMED